jgi:predicted permease
MAGDIPLTLLYTFLAFLQIYIYFSAGTITGIKKIWTSKSIKAVSEMLVKFFLPLYATLELARMSSWPNVEIMWILIISVIVALTIALAFGFIIQKIFKLDVRFSNTYPYILAMPSLGTLPLVLGRALCYPGGMLEGDPQCSNVLGFMMMNFLIFEMCVFSMGFLFMPRDANFTNVLMEKLSYISHILIGKNI